MIRPDIRLLLACFVVFVVAVSAVPADERSVFEDLRVVTRVSFSRTLLIEDP